MPRTLFPMATGTHRLNNRFLVEEQEERGCSERHGDFHQAHTLPQIVCVCVFVCLETQTLVHKNKKKRISGTHVVHSHTHTPTDTQTGAKLWVSFLPVIPPQWLLSPVCLHTRIIDFQIKRETNTRQETLCNDMCLYT